MNKDSITESKEKFHEKQGVPIVALCFLSLHASVSNVAESQQDSSSDLITEGATVFLTTAEVSNLRQKAEKGDANAEYSLGILYMEGLGVLRDDTEGVKWHKAA